MSLDFYLYPHSDKVAVPKEPTHEMVAAGLIASLRSEGINANTVKEIYAAILAIGGEPIETEPIFHVNITHNLNSMAEAAGVYMPLWRPEEIGATKASQIIEMLETGLAKLKEDPREYRKYDSSNGWGTYKHFVPFVEEVLGACKLYPEARIEVSR